MSYNDEDPTPQTQAEDTLVHYIKLLWDKAGLSWDSDNETEVRGIVSDTIAAAREGDHR